MTFLRKHLLGATILLLVITCFGLYLFLVRPVRVRRQELIKVMEEKIARLRGYQDDPPSPEMIDRLSQDKKRLENQYEEVTKTLSFARHRVFLPEETREDPLYFDRQISKFEEQIERAEKELARLGEAAGIALPERLGFRRERPRSKEELSLLLSQLTIARELVPLVIKSGVSHFSILPLPFPLEEVADPARERARPGEMPPGMEMMPPEMEMPPEMMEMMMMMPPGMEMPPGREPRPRREAPPVVRDRFSQVLKLEELKFELGVRGEISALTNLLYQLANHPYFFTVQDLEIRSVVRERRPVRTPEMEMMPPEMEMPPEMMEMMMMPPGMERPPGARRDRRRRRPTRPPGMEMPIDEEPWEELEARLIIATRLFPSNSE